MEGEKYQLWVRSWRVSEKLSSWVFVNEYQCMAKAWKKMNAKGVDHSKPLTRLDKTKRKGNHLS